jgi:hypothetical protein
MNRTALNDVHKPGDKDASALKTHYDSNSNAVTMMVLGCEVAMIGRHDFPEHYVNMKHPEDYGIMDSAIRPEFIVHEVGIHSRLIIRISWRSGTKYVPMSFIVDTGVPFPFYFSETGSAIMRAHRLLISDENGNQFVQVHAPDGSARKFQYMDTPSHFEPANLIGLRFLLHFPMLMTPDSFTLTGLGPFL